MYERSETGARVGGALDREAESGNRPPSQFLMSALTIGRQRSLGESDKNPGAMGRLLLLTGVAITATGSALCWPANAVAHPKHSNICPPGLAKKNAMCMPPGRYRKLFDVGERIPPGYAGLMSYSEVPDGLKHRYRSDLDPRSRYIYDRQYLYRVDPRTMVVTQVLSALMRP